MFWFLIRKSATKFLPEVKYKCKSAGENFSRRKKWYKKVNTMSFQNSDQEVIFTTVFCLRFDFFRNYNLKVDVQIVRIVLSQFSWMIKLKFQFQLFFRRIISQVWNYWELMLNFKFNKNSIKEISKKNMYSQVNFFTNWQRIVNTNIIFRSSENNCRKVFSISSVF